MTIRMEERDTWKTKRIDYEQYIYIEYIFSHWGKYSNTYMYNKRERETRTIEWTGQIQSKKSHKKQNN